MEKIKMGVCSQIALKRKMIGSIGVYVDEECGNKGKTKIEYTLNDKIITKTLCIRHFKSVTNWLGKINIPYNII